MAETLLSPSNVLIFGRKLEDLSIVAPRWSGGLKARLVATTPVTLSGAQNVDGIAVKKGDRILAAGQSLATENGIYLVPDPIAGPWTRADDAKVNEDFAGGMLVNVTEGTSANIGYWTLVQDDPVVGVNDINFKKTPTDPRHGPFAEPRRGVGGDVEAQLRTTTKGDHKPPCFARIYGFSYEGAYYELPSPALFLVHGDGYPASEKEMGVKYAVRRARGLGSPSLSGLAAADFQFAEDLMAWSYDKADYTIRMDVQTGMFEDVLLPMIDGGGPGVSGARVSGARVSGARVSGARVSGARLSGSSSD